ncbi:hypothetical protein U2I54_20045 [Bacillus pseudomycoides]|uniref:HEPN AbiJ-N-terminal domain-containing protein n=1 Tax=Bacillus bingmayongensis TaxID=1150157 RepID=A0ABU5K0Z2_9BACI|nr:hypothetical protein [Bacillus pseudomycoides]
MKFSERIGAIPVKQLIQVNSMDEALKNSLWNKFQSYIWIEAIRKIKPKYSNADLINGEFGKSNTDEINSLILFLWEDFFKLPFTQIPSSHDNFLKYLEEYFFNANWYEIYDFIEFIVQNLTFLSSIELFKEQCNQTLEREKSAYRFIGDKLTQITSEQEIESIENAINYKSHKAFVDRHIEQALRLLTSRDTPDYINSIKESISAVESICKVIVEDEKGTLGQALGKLEQKGIIIHDTLKEGFKRIYWYTSDGDGIRHAHKEIPNVSYEDAQFMLITCSSFCNYLIEKANKAGIDIT